jgi:Putative Actinobacterial Holin-X, holin superfamily III
VIAPGAGAPEADDAPYALPPERSIAALIADLANDLGALLRLEFALFKLELAEKLRRLRRGIMVVAIGGFLVCSAWLVLLAAAVLALMTIVRPWLAALIVAAVMLLVAAVMLYLGKRWLAARSLIPRRSLNALREDEAWIKERLR